MKYSRAEKETATALSSFSEQPSNDEQFARWRRDNNIEDATASLTQHLLSPDPGAELTDVAKSRDWAKGHVKSAILSFTNMNQHGELLVGFMRARKKTFIDRLKWNLPQTEGMEFDQYDTPTARWIVVHEFGEVLAGIRLVPTTAKCGIYSYMLKDAQKGLLENIPKDVLFFDAPVDPSIWEASRLFISEHVPAERRAEIQFMLMEQMAQAARDVGAKHVIGIVPAVWSRWLRRLGLNAVPVGPKFSIEGTVTQAALFNVYQKNAA